MKYKNQFEFKVYGERALFSDPVSRAGGEKTTLLVPTYEAIKNVAKSIYFKPTFQIIVDEVKVLNRINTRPIGIRPLKYDGKNDLAYYTYLIDAAYAVRCHFEWNYNHPELEKDRNEDKHFQIMKRCIEKGGRRDIYLGARECQAYVEPCVYDDEVSVYEGQTIPFGLNYSSIIYADEAINEEDKGYMSVCFQNITMDNGIIKFLRPDQCTVKRKIHKQPIKVFSSDKFITADMTAKEVGINGLDQSACKGL